MFWYTPRRDYGSQKEESLSEGPTGERVQEGNKILIGPSTARRHHTNRPVRISCSTNFARYHYLLVLDIAPPTQEI